MRDISEIRSWLTGTVAEQLRQVLEAMAGEAPGVQTEAKAPLPAGDLRFWESTISVAPEASLLLAASEDGWRKVGGRVLAGAGLDIDDDETLRSTFQETVDQSLSGLAQSATAQLGREIRSSPTKESGQHPKGAEDWSSLEFAWSDGMRIELFLMWHPALLAGFQEASEPGPEPPAASTSTVALPSLAMPELRNAELLFDVELPVCVSFGRAHLQLRDVMKLTTGSVVELNRTVTEPVEVIVNNCVIARGEVVVVEGNFGVRIQEVISRQERLRTLY